MPGNLTMILMSRGIIPATLTGVTLARTHLVKIVLLLAFGISHVPGYGLRAITQVAGADVQACCDGCSSSPENTDEGSEDSSSEDKSHPCSICRLLADVFVADVAEIEVNCYLFGIQETPTAVSRVARAFPPTPPSRGPPRMA